MTYRFIKTCIPALTLVVAPHVAHAQNFDVVDATIGGVHAAFKAGKLTCHALVQAHLDRIAAYDQDGPKLNAIQHVNAHALAEADSLDGVLRAALKTKRPLSPLHCIPVLLKDQVETRDMPTTYGSAIFKGFVPLRDATIVERLHAAGAIILAKTNMGEFASRFVGSAFGIIRNAYDPTRNPSGSSGGTASGVAASFGLVGIGEDTGGSIRGPSAVSNLVGLRPTLPLVSRFGMLPANPTQDTMGPMARTVTDAALLLDAIVGYDPRDPITAYAVGHSPKSYTAGLRADALRGARIGVLRDPMDTSIKRSSEEYQKVRTVIDRAVGALQAQGATIVDSVVIGKFRLVDDIGNDYETEQATDAYLKEHPNAPVKTFKEIMLSGAVTPWRARGMMGLVGKTTSDPGYLKVIQQREALRLSVLQAMADQRLDAIVYSTFDAPPTRIADDVLTNAKTKDGYGKGDNRGLSPAIGFPALVVPAGFTSDSLPVGLEFLGRPFAEEQLLGFGYAFEQATHHRRPPPLTPALSGKR